MANRTITVPMNAAGTMTFQYGDSPATCSFNQSGVWQVTFTGSWNMIANVTYVSNLPGSSIYFSQIYGPQYNVTINADWLPNDAELNVGLELDDASTMYTTPCTFGSLTGTHTFTVPSAGPQGRIFMNWTTGETAPTITVLTGGTYTAYYELGQLSVTISPTSVVMNVTQSQLFNSTVLWGTPSYSYQWYLNNALVLGTPGSTWTFTPMSPG